MRSRRCSGGGRSTILPSPTPTRPAAGSGGSASPYLPPYPLSSRLGAGGTALARRAPSQPSSSLWSSSAALPVPSCSARTRQFAQRVVLRVLQMRVILQRHRAANASIDEQKHLGRYCDFFFFLQPVYLNKPIPLEILLVSLLVHEKYLGNILKDRNLSYRYVFYCTHCYCANPGGIN